ncbi:MAG: putative membrane protein [Yoonia sp.]|jgi:uncharacterized membrane protein
MLRLASMNYSIIGTSFAAVLIITVLTVGYNTLVLILIAAAVAAVPVNYFVAQAITQNKI